MHGGLSLRESGAQPRNEKPSRWTGRGVSWQQRWLGASEGVGASPAVPGKAGWSGRRAGELHEAGSVRGLPLHRKQPRAGPTPLNLTRGQGPREMPSSAQRLMPPLALPRSPERGSTSHSLMYTSQKTQWNKRRPICNFRHTRALAQAVCNVCGQI